MLLRSGSMGRARYAVTDRSGGHSRKPYAELNLGDHVGDDPHAVARNRAALLAELPGVTELAFMNQVHGADVAEVGRPLGPDRPVADALVTTDQALGLAVLSADCVPVLLATDDGGVLGVAHAGRRGVRAGVVAATVARMRAVGARPDRMAALVGPAVCGRCYEVPEAMAAEMVAAEPAARATSRSGTPALDLKAAVVAQLVAAGVEAVEVDPGCTVESPELFSHRRATVTGRIASVVWTPA